MPHLLPAFICLWIPKLVPYTGCCKKMDINFNPMVQKAKIPGREPAWSRG